MSEELEKANIPSEDSFPDMDEKEEVSVEKPILATEIQNAKRTSAKKLVPPISPDKGETKEELDRAFSVNFFLGLDDEVVTKYGSVLTAWLQYQTARQELDAKKIDHARFNAVEANYNEVCEKSLPDKSPEEINRFCALFYDFSQNTVDWVAFNNGNTSNPNLSNRVQRADDVVGTLITAMKPGMRKSKKFSMSELIRRDYRRNSSEPENFDSFLPNSFVHFRIARPGVLELGRLVKNIANTVKGFVRDINANSQTISRIAGYRVIFDYLMSKTINTNIKDTSDFNELASSILLSDFKQMLVDLTAAAHWNGVDFTFTCLKNSCDYESVRSIDLKETVYVDMSAMTDEQAAEYANMMNMVKTLSREDVARLQKQTEYPFETKIFSEDKRTYLVVKQPTLLTAFQCFDFIREKLDPEVGNLRNSVLDNKQFEAELQSLMARLSFCEYVHWVDEIHFVPEEGSDDEETIYKRGNGEGDEFNKGLYDILSFNQALADGLMKFVTEFSEKMTFSIVGIPNYICPKCKTASSNEKENKAHEHSLTPYDPFMHFFIRSQLDQQKAIQRLGEIESGTR